MAEKKSPGGGMPPGVPVSVAADTGLRVPLSRTAQLVHEDQLALGPRDRDVSQVVFLAQLPSLLGVR